MTKPVLLSHCKLMFKFRLLFKPYIGAAFYYCKYHTHTRQGFAQFRYRNQVLRRSGFRFIKRRNLRPALRYADRLTPIFSRAQIPFHQIAYDQP